MVAFNPLGPPIRLRRIGGIERTQRGKAPLQRPTGDRVGAHCDAPMISPSVIPAEAGIQNHAGLVCPAR